MTISDLEPDVRVRTRTRPGPENPGFGGAGHPGSARAHAIPDGPDVRQDSQALEIVDHSALISRARRPDGHLAAAGLAMAENFFTATPPTTVRQAWAGIAGDPGEERGRGLAALLLWLCGLVRALALSALYALALAVSTRRRTAGTLLFTGLLAGVYAVTRALLP